VRLVYLTVLVLVAACVPARAQSTNFSISDVQVAYGWSFNEPGILEHVPKSDITFENISGWSWGNSYLFVDVLRSWSEADANAKEVYAEFYPSMSLGKVFGEGPSKTLIRDVGITLGLATGVRSTGPAPFVVLPGITIDLNVPRFRALSIGAYAYIDRGRFEGHLTSCGSTTFQVTPSWSLPFSVGNGVFSFDGFFDVIGKHGECAAQFLTQPALKLDLSRFWHKPGVLQAGARWVYWHGKYGIEGEQDNLVMPVVIWTF